MPVLLHLFSESRSGVYPFRLGVLDFHLIKLKHLYILIKRLLAKLLLTVLSIQIFKLRFRNVNTIDCHYYGILSRKSQSEKSYSCPGDKLFIHLSFNFCYLLTFMEHGNSVFGNSELIFPISI